MKSVQLPGLCLRIESGESRRYEAAKVPTESQQSQCLPPTGVIAPGMLDLSSKYDFRSYLQRRFTYTLLLS